MNALCNKQGTNCTSVGKWKALQPEIEKQIEDQRRGAMTQMREDDGILQIKDGIRAFYELNNSMPKALKIQITGNLFLTRHTQYLLLLICYPTQRRCHLSQST
mmetsp:Transcript_14544/g.31052  ORF Transcript_14544/g.31052 Transcript_14544/m.31052 type:complete len:103 (+) Transcript_14544:812-1120(+)